MFPYMDARIQVREMPDLMVMGQQEFFSKVEKRHSQKKFEGKYMRHHVRNLFRQVV